MAIKDLNRLLNAMDPVLSPETYMFCFILKPNQKILSKGLGFFKEQEGITIILSEKDAPIDALKSTPQALITLNVNSDLNAVGFITIISQRIAAMDILLNVVSAYYHDHLFVPRESAQKVMGILHAITVISPLSFSCGSTVTDVRDNKSYTTILIGTQCWMAENLNYGIKNSGTANQRDNCIPEKYCYNDNDANCSVSGGLYQWDEMMKYDNAAGIQGVCPPAWHVPTETEWNVLFAFYISNGFAGSPLKNTGYSGFNASIKGVQFKNVNWNFLDFATFFWSSNSQGPFKAWAHGMNTYNPSVSFYPGSRSNAFSVRCIKD